jgi:hypothetical protein
MRKRLRLRMREEDAGKRLRTMLKGQQAMNLLKRTADESQERDLVQSALAAEVDAVLERLSDLTGAGSSKSSEMGASKAGAGGGAGGGKGGGKLGGADASGDGEGDGDDGSSADDSAPSNEKLAAKARSNEKLTNLRLVLMRHFNEMDALFKYYSAFGGGDAASDVQDSSSTVSFTEYRHMIRKCHIQLAR